MNKAPAFQFYVGDYLKDTRSLSLSAKGAWMDLLCIMWHSEPRGEVTYPLVGFARLFGCQVEQAKTVIDELAEMQTCDRVTHGDGKVTVINRRMKREAEERKRANDRQLRYVERKKRGSDAENDGKVTFPSSSSSSTSSAIKETEPNGSGASAPARKASRKKKPKGEQKSRPPNPVYECFAGEYQRVYETPYPRKQGDFVQLDALTKRLNGALALDDWGVAVRNFLASPMSEHSLADLAVRYPTFHKHALDRFNKPVAPEVEEQDALSILRANRQKAGRH